MKKLIIVVIFAHYALAHSMDQSPFLSSLIDNVSRLGNQETNILIENNLRNTWQAFFWQKHIDAHNPRALATLENPIFHSKLFIFLRSTHQDYHRHSAALTEKFMQKLVVHAKDPDNPVAKKSLQVLKFIKIFLESIPYAERDLLIYRIACSGLNQTKTNRPDHTNSPKADNTAHDTFTLTKEPGYLKHLMLLIISAGTLISATYFIKRHFRSKKESLNKRTHAKIAAESPQPTPTGI